MGPFNLFCDMQLGRKTLNIVSLLDMAYWESLVTATAMALGSIRGAGDYLRLEFTVQYERWQTHVLHSKYLLIKYVIRCNAAAFMSWSFAVINRSTKEHLVFEAMGLRVREFVLPNHN